MMGPQFSVVIPVHNGELYLRQAIDSALSQRDVSVEVLVVDDASTDATAGIARSYGDRVAYVHLEKQPTSIAVTNEGLKRATGTYVCILHHDDYYLSGKLRAHLDVMEAHPSVGLSYSAQWYVGPAGERLARLRSRVRRRSYVVPGRVELKHLVVQNYINFCNAVVRRSAYAAYGPFIDRLWVSAEWVMWASLAMRCDVAYVDDPLVCYRMHRGGQTLARTADTAEYREQLEAGYDAIWNDPAMPDLPAPLRGVSRANIELSMSLLHLLRHEPGSAAASAARVLTTLPPWRLRQLLWSSALVPRVLPRVRLLLSR